MMIIDSLFTPLFYTDRKTVHSKAHYERDPLDRCPCKCYRCIDGKCNSTLFPFGLVKKK